MGKYEGLKKSLSKTPLKTTKRGKGRPPKSEIKVDRNLVKKASSLLITGRPKRQIIPKSRESTAGLSWKEEKNIQKAMYASLHEPAALNTTSSTASIAPTKLKRKRGRKKGLKLLMPRSRYMKKNGSSIEAAVPLTNGSISNGISGQTTPTSSMVNDGVAEHAPKIVSNGCTVRAQRKFAQGSIPNSPCVTPIKTPARPPSPVKYMMKKPPKTEDFIDFLCLRGSPLLPKELDFFNYCDPKLFMAMNTPIRISYNKSTSRPSTPISLSEYSNGVAGSSLSARLGVAPPRGRGRPCKVSKEEDTSTDLDTDLGVKPLVNMAYASNYDSVSDPSYITDDDKYHNKTPTTATTDTNAVTTSSVIETRAKLALDDLPMRLRSCGSSIQLNPVTSSSIQLNPSTAKVTPQLSVGGEGLFFSNKAATSTSASRQSHDKNTPTKSTLSPKKSVTNNHMSRKRPSSPPTTPTISQKLYPKSPRTVKKERGKKLIRRAKETIAKQQQRKKQQQRLRDEQSGRDQGSGRESEVFSDSGGEERRLTRRLREMRETEEFQQARLQTLYRGHKPTTSSSDHSSVAGMVRSEKHPSTIIERRLKNFNKDPIPKPGDPPPGVTPPKRIRRSLQSDYTLYSYIGISGSPTTVIDLTKSTPPADVKMIPFNQERNHSRSKSSSTGNHNHEKHSIYSFEFEDDLDGARTLRSSNSPGRASLASSDISSVTVGRSPSSRSLLDKSCRSPGRASVNSDVSDTGRTKSGRSPGRASVNSDVSDNCRTKPVKSCKKLVLPKLTLRQNFPSPKDAAKVVPAPTYHPSSEQFQDPIEYIESIKADAAPYGLCCIAPPEGWKPECCVSQELRFITEVQHLHKMKGRWGANVQEMESIRKHLASQGHRFDSPPVVGGIELDLPALSKAISNYGGIQAVADDKRKWMKVADTLRIPKWAQDRSFKLYDAYCKFLLSFDSLSTQEKDKLKQQILIDKNRGRLNTDCVLKGKSRSLAEFFNSARSTLVHWFDGPPSSAQVEGEYWRILNEQTDHVAVHSAHVDTKHCGGGFPNKKDSPYSPHGWNFNVLQHQNQHSVLNHLGLVSGVTIPELHMGMLFSTNCWCSDPHGLPYISYLHTGGDIIWYCIPKSEEAKFKKVLQDMAEDLIDADSPIWLPVDSIMLSPEDLVSAGVSVCRIIQKQGDFMVVFPQSFTATICCGYNISESIRFATAEWIPTGYAMSLALHESCEPELFSMDQLLMRLATGDNITTDVLQHIVPSLEDMIHKEISLRQKLQGAGLKKREKIQKDKAPEVGRKKKSSMGLGVEDETRCEVSKKICYLSMVLNDLDGCVYSLEHAYPLIHRKKNIKQYKLMYRYTESELLELLERVKSKHQESRTKH